MVDFFKKEDEQRIIAAIREAEARTSGEIRVHLEKELDSEVTAAAARLFQGLHMERTEERNGVLIFLVPSAKKFAIIGDTGINEKVPGNFWQEVRDLMQGHFRAGRFAEGVCEGIRLSGQKLQTYFPLKQGDKNELPDEISYGK